MDDGTSQEMDHRAARQRSSSDRPRWLAGVTTIVAVAAMVAYVVFVVLQWDHADGDTTVWSRHQELLNGIEAIAFAAAGVLFGTSVQGQVTKKAEQRAAELGAEAAHNARDAEKGRALQRAVEARAAARDEHSREVMRGGSPRPAGDPLSELIELARRYDEAT